MNNLKSAAIRGGVANLFAQAVNALLRIVVIVVFARLLDPQDFGIMAMVTSSFGILALFKDFGLSTVTIQQSKVSDEQLSGLFWINIIAGAVLACITLAAAWPISVFYDEPRLRTLTVAFASTFVLSAAGIQHSALLQRQMRFSALAIIDTSSLLGGVLVGLGMAVLGMGYWALLGMSIANLVISTAQLWLRSGWTPSSPSRSGGVGKMLRAGGLLTVNGIVMHLAQNLDKILLGRRFGAEGLGVYSRAQQLVSFPTDVINAAVNGVLVSALSRVKEDPVRLRSYFLKSYSLLVAVTMPLATIFAVFADDIVRLILGPKWIDAIPVFRFLAPTVLVYGVLSPMFPLLIATNNIGRSLRMALVLGPVMIAGYSIGMQWGVVGAAAGLSASLAIWSIPHMAWTVRGTPVKFFDVLKATGMPILAALASSYPAHLLGVVAGESTGPMVRLLVGVVAFALIYAGLLLVVLRQWALFKDVLATLLRRPAAD